MQRVAALVQLQHVQADRLRMPLGGVGLLALDLLQARLQAGHLALLAFRFLGAGQPPAHLLALVLKRIAQRAERCELAAQLGARRFGLGQPRLQRRRLLAARLGRPRAPFGGARLLGFQRLRQRVADTQRVVALGGDRSEPPRVFAPLLLEIGGARLQIGVLLLGDLRRALARRNAGGELLARGPARFELLLRQRELLDEAFARRREALHLRLGGPEALRTPGDLAAQALLGVARREHALLEAVRPRQPFLLLADGAHQLRAQIGDLGRQPVTRELGRFAAGHQGRGVLTEGRQSVRQLVAFGHDAVVHRERRPGDLELAGYVGQPQPQRSDLRQRLVEHRRRFAALAPELVAQARHLVGQIGRERVRRQVGVSRFAQRRLQHRDAGGILVGARDGLGGLRLRRRVRALDLEQPRAHGVVRRVGRLAATLLGLACGQRLGQRRLARGQRLPELLQRRGARLLALGQRVAGALLGGLGGVRARAGIRQRALERVAALLALAQAAAQRRAALGEGLRRRLGLLFARRELGRRRLAGGEPFAQIGQLHGRHLACSDRLAQGALDLGAGHVRGGRVGRRGRHTVGVRRELGAQLRALVARCRQPHRRRLALGARRGERHGVLVALRRQRRCQRDVCADVGLEPGDRGVAFRQTFFEQRALVGEGAVHVVAFGLERPEGARRRLGLALERCERRGVGLAPLLELCRNRAQRVALDRQRPNRLAVRGQFSLVASLRGNSADGGLAPQLLRRVGIGAPLLVELRRGRPQRITFGGQGVDAFAVRAQLSLEARRGGGFALTGAGLPVVALRRQRRERLLAGRRDAAQFADELFPLGETGLQLGGGDGEPVALVARRPELLGERHHPLPLPVDLAGQRLALGARFHQRLAVGAASACDCSSSARWPCRSPRSSSASLVRADTSAASAALHSAMSSRSRSSWSARSAAAVTAATASPSNRSCSDATAARRSASIRTDSSSPRRRWASSAWRSRCAN
jgi:hypothetical protein